MKYILILLALLSFGLQTLVSMDQAAKQKAALEKKRQAEARKRANAEKGVRDFQQTLVQNAQFDIRKFQKLRQDFLHIHLLGWKRGALNCKYEQCQLTYSRDFSEPYSVPEHFIGFSKNSKVSVTDNSLVLSDLPVLAERSQSSAEPESSEQPAGVDHTDVHATFKKLEDCDTAVINHGFFGYLTKKIGQGGDKSTSAYEFSQPSSPISQYTKVIDVAAQWQSLRLITWKLSNLSEMQFQYLLAWLNDHSGVGLTSADYSDGTFSFTGVTYCEIN